MTREKVSVLDELQMRVFWRHWNELMTGEVSPPEGGIYDPETEGVRVAVTSGRT
jgi:hypothetical protein